MNGHAFEFHGARLVLLPSGALWWPDEALLCLSDMHLARSERFARNAGALLPPYETRDTLHRLEADMAQTGPRTIVCLGDSFDDSVAAAGLDEDARAWLLRLQAGRRWIWIEGNHDPGPIDLGGSHHAAYARGPLTFRHIAAAGARGEISGHYHPKAKVPRGRARPAMLYDSVRVILPAYGTYTGGLHSHDAALTGLMEPGALAVMTGQPPIVLPMPR